ncbi:MAG: restriction endonuclease subunit S, partial [Alphaproteobacteria bacterium]|nr:restriction endonuclease subunit S [Alphaproteobacteria bacterium]
MSWSITTLGDSVDFNPVVRLSTGQQYPFVPMEAIRPGERIVEANQTRMAGGGAKFQDGDVLFARITPCLENGKIAQFRTSNLRPAFGSTEFIVFRAKLDKLDQNFLYYLTLTQSVRAPAEKSMSGATGRQRADINAIRQIEIPLPLLATQRRIAQILSAYDDLIENNTRRIAILEEMARRLFEDWFIHFRYPGGEGPDAGLPEGWALRKIGDLLSFSGGGDWGSDAPTENENKEVRVIRGTDFDDGRVGRQMRAPVRFIT